MKKAKAVGQKIGNKCPPGGNGEGGKKEKLFIRKEKVKRK